MAFPPGFLDELRARVGLVSLVGRRVKLTRRGREHVGLCPFHNERTPSFTVSEDKGFYHCFGCGAHGDVIGFAMQTKNLSFPEAVERLAGEAGLAVPQATPEQAAANDRREALLACVEAAAAWFQGRLAAPEGAEARDYLAGRGLGEATVQAFRLGLAPAERGALRKALNPRGFNDALLAEAGLIKLPDPEEAGEGPRAEPRDYLFHRIVFPITDPRGRVVGFGGRALGDSRAKYLNSPDGPLFHKGRLLYNFDKAREAARGSGELLLVEGYMDVIALAEAGFQAAVAPLGTALTEEQIALAWRLVPEPLICLDGDAAGRRAALRAAQRALPILEPGRSLRFALLPPGEDPDSLLRGRGREALREVLDAALPLSELVWHQALEGRRLDTPERRAGLRRALRETLAEIRDKEVREAYWDEMERRQQALFDPMAGARASSGNRGGRPARFGAGFGGGRPERSWSGRGWKPGPDRGSTGARGGLPDVSVPPLSRARPGRAAVERQERVLLAALINHPALLLDAAETLAALRLRNRALERLLTVLLDLAAGPEDLDTEAIRRHLCDQGFSGLLTELLHRRVYALGPFARPEAAPAEVADAWKPFLARLGERQTPGEAAEAAKRLTEDMSEENLTRLQVVQRLSHGGSE